MKRSEFIKRYAELKVHGLCGLGMRQLHKSTHGQVVTKEAHVCLQSRQLALTGFGAASSPSHFADFERSPCTLHEYCGVDNGMCFMCQTRRGLVCGANKPAGRFAEFRHRRCATCTSVNTHCVVCVYASEFLDVENVMLTPLIQKVLEWTSNWSTSTSILVVCYNEAVLNCLVVAARGLGVAACHASEWSSKALDRHTSLRTDGGALHVFLNPLCDDVSAFVPVMGSISGCAILGSDTIPTWILGAVVDPAIVVKVATFTYMEDTECHARDSTTLL